MGTAIGLRSDHSRFRRGCCGAAVDTNLKWLSQMDIEDLMRSCRDGPGQLGASEVRASLLERAYDASKFGTRQCPLDIHKRSSKVGSLDLTDTGDKNVVGRRHERGTGSDGRGSAMRRMALKRTVKTCGPDAATLASSFCGRFP